MINTIHTGSKVSLEYKLSVDGVLLEDSSGSRPLKYTHGKGKLLRGFVKRLEGLKAGDERMFELPPEEAHGPVSDSVIQEVNKSDLPDGVKPKVGITNNWKNDSGKLIPFKVTEINELNIVLNNNHPMAGKSLVIQVEILTIE